MKRALFPILLAIACGAGVAQKTYPDAGSGPPGEYPPGCDPADAGCITPCSTGNSLKVGEYCARGAGQCSANSSGGKAFICTTDFDKDAGLSFCTMSCSRNADCGDGAICTNGGQGGPKGCVPAVCDPGDPGSPDGG